MGNETRDLETAVLDGHRAGQTWGQFYSANAPALVGTDGAGIRKLLALLASGHLPIEPCRDLFGDPDGSEAPA